MIAEESQSQTASGASPQPRRLSRTGLVIWLLAPVVIVILMAVLLDWSQAKRKPAPVNQPNPAGALP